MNLPNTGWICPRCQGVHAPHVDRCGCAPAFPIMPPYAVPPMALPMALCGCPPGSACLNAACPHRVIVTCAASAAAPN